ncbi:MAG: tetratricopeptide repeat protein [Planctomycetes bacterium]|nr:tetratricopeptide repeat protein [Planctomycetota bacterium]
MHLPSPTSSRRRTRLIGLAFAGAAAVLGGLAPIGSRSPLDFRAFASAESSRLVAEANRKIRQQDPSGAIKLLEQAIAADPQDIDAHIRYQDVAKAALGAGPLRRKYDEAATAKPDDAVAQFLAARLLPAADAVDAFDKQTLKFKDSPWPCAGKARALEDQGKFADAAQSHGDAIKRAGEAAGVRFLAYRAYGLEQGSQWALAVEAWRAVLAKSPSDLSAHFGVVEALRKNGAIDDAMLALDAAAKVGASEPEVAYRRGLIEFDAGHSEKAVAAFDAALAIDRGMLEALCAACDASLQLARDKADQEKRDLTDKDFEKAISYGDRAAVSTPESPYAHFVLGAAHEAAAETNADHLDTALKEYDEALNRLPIPGPEKVRALTAKAYILLQKADWDPALDTAQKAIDIDKSCLVAYGHAGHALAAQNKQLDAINKYYKAGLKIDPKCARLLHDMGVALWELKKPNDAKKPLEDARTYDAKNGRYRLSLGELYYELKRNKEATVELLEATELLPRNVDAWRSYGRACYAAKTWDECTRAYEKVVALDADATDEYLYLAVVYADQLGNKDKAREHVKKFREKGGQDPNLDDWMNQLLEDTGTKKP